MKVVVVEDQVLFQELLVRLLKERLNYEVAGVAADGPSAIKLARQHQPDLLILDILIPEISGIMVAALIRRELPQTRILALSSETDPKTLIQIHGLKLAGFVDKKEATVEVLLKALLAISEGRCYFSDSMLRVIRSIRANPQSFQKILTRREQEVLSHIGGGLSDPEIGKVLGLSITSVQSHRRNLLRKLDVHSTPELIRYALDNGFWKARFTQMGLGDSYHIHE